MSDATDRPDHELARDEMRALLDVGHLKASEAAKKPAIQHLVWVAEAQRQACEVKQVRGFDGVRFEAVAPSREDVISCLAMDSDAIDHATYDEWASELGYDADSRKGEAIYRACLEIALKLRAAFGEAILAQLRELSARF